MALQQQQDLLARIYTDPNIRKQFLSEPMSFADDLGLSPEDAEALAMAAGYEVNWFADSLVNKRLREVRKRLPLTEQTVGTEEFERLFRKFAEEFSPISVKKHLEDTLAFARTIVLDGTVGGRVKDLARFEARRLGHGGYGRHISFCLLRSDPRRAGDEPSDGRQGFGIWIAIGRWSRIVYSGRAKRMQT